MTLPSVVRSPGKHAHAGTWITVFQPASPTSPPRSRRPRRTRLPAARQLALPTRDASAPTCCGHCVIGRSDSFLGSPSLSLALARSRARSSVLVRVLSSASAWTRRSGVWFAGRAIPAHPSRADRASRGLFRPSRPCRLAPREAAIGTHAPARAPYTPGHAYRQRR